MDIDKGLLNATKKKEKKKESLQWQSSKSAALLILYPNGKIWLRQNVLT